MKAFLFLLATATAALAQPWQWELVEPDWRNPSGFPALSPAEFPVCVADVTGDGLADIVQFGVNIYLSVQDTNGHWTNVPTAGGLQDEFQPRVTASNLDTDAALELVICSDISEPAITCYKLNMSQEPWQWELRLDLIQDRYPELLDYIRSIVWGNFDEDVYEEVAILRQTQFFAEALDIYQRSADGELWTPEYYFEFTYLLPRYQYSGDFDHDGDLDLAVEMAGIDDLEGTMIFENTPDGLQWNDLDLDENLLAPGGGDLDGDGEWEFLFMNSCTVPPFSAMDGPFLLEINAIGSYTRGRNFNDIVSVIGRLHDDGNGYVAGVSNFFCFSPWGGPSTTRTDFCNLMSEDHIVEWEIGGSLFHAFSTADINGDGLRDLLGEKLVYFGSDWFEPRWSVYRNVGSEQSDLFVLVQDLDFIVEGREFFDDFNNPRLGDIDGDNRAELILYPLNTVFPGTIEIFRMEQLAPTEVFTRAYDLDNGLPDSISSFEAVDLDGDGLVEILPVVNGERMAYFFRNGQWESYEGILPQINGVIRGFADWDNDGTTDIFTDEGIYLNLTPTAADDEQILHPTSFVLSAYPNPFNAQTTIVFDLPNASNVSLVLFDLLGREVETILNERMNAGTHTINYSASELPSGVYFAQIDAGEFHATQKLLLLK